MAHLLVAFKLLLKSSVQYLPCPPDLKLQHHLHHPQPTFAIPLTLVSFFFPYRLSINMVYVYNSLSVSLSYSFSSMRARSFVLFTDISQTPRMVPDT